MTDSNFFFVLVQVLNIAIMLLWLVLALWALFSLRKRVLPPLAGALWALIIIVIPIFGAAAFFIVDPRSA